jgi:hypothetical protein
MADDRLAAELAAIRELLGERAALAVKAMVPERDTGQYVREIALAVTLAGYVFPLLVAVEAVLELHQPGPVLLLGALCKNHAEYRFFSIDSTEQERLRACPDCQAVLRIHCTCGSGRFDRCRARVAITSALLGEENPGG